MTPRLAIAAALTMALHPAHAQFFSANELYERMTGAEAITKAQSYGYIQGIFDRTIGDTQCAPQSVNTRQVVDLVTLNMVKYPQHRDKPASVFVEATLMATWPCPTKPVKGNV